MKSNNIKLEAKAFSLMGKRSNQQDAYRLNQSKHGIVAIVCDGMGGLNDGQVASNYVADKVNDIFSVIKPDDEFSHNIEKLFYQLDDSVFGLADQEGKRLGCGTTIVAYLIYENKLYWFSVGDSKAYIVRNEEIHSLVREHNYAFVLKEKLNNNEISEADYQTEKSKGEQLISYLGMGSAEMFDVNKAPFKLNKGDTLFLCTDGVYRTLSENEIKEILIEKTPLEIKIREIENKINAHKVGNQDNATGIIIEVK